MPHSEPRSSRGASSRPLTVQLSLRALAKAQAAGWTHRRLALMIGKSNAYAGKLFAGTGALDLGWSRQLADALGMGLDELFHPPVDGVGEAPARFEGRARQADEDELLRRLAPLDDAAHAEALGTMLALLPPPGDDQAAPAAAGAEVSGKAGRPSR